MADLAKSWTPLPEAIRRKIWYFATHTDYTPHPAQAEIHKATERFVMAVCGTRFGKTRAAGMEVCNEASKGKRRIWIVAPQDELTDKVFREVWVQVVEKDKPPIKRASERERGIYFKDGGFIEGKTAENPTSLLGEGIDYMVIDEAARVKQMVWEQYLRARLTDRQGRALFITTPRGYNWIYDLWRRGQDGNEKMAGWRSFRFPTIRNPYVRPDEIEMARTAMSSTAFQQEFEAAFTAMSGRVYPEFDRQIYVAEAPEGVQFKTILGGIDWGYRNPAVALVIGIDGDGAVAVIDEAYNAGLTTEEHIAKIRFLQDKYKVWRWFADPSDPEAITKARREGLIINKATNALEAGIDAVRAKMKIINSKKYLTISKNCSNLIRELEIYSFPEQTDTRAAKEEPLKLSDHACDALRYAVMGAERAL